MCLKGTIEAPKKPGNYRCRRCGAISKDDENMCKPVKIKKKDVEKKATKATKKEAKNKSRKKSKKKKKEKKKKK